MPLIEVEVHEFGAAKYEDIPAWLHQIQPPHQHSTPLVVPSFFFSVV